MISCSHGQGLPVTCSEDARDRKAASGGGLLGALSGRILDTTSVLLLKRGCLGCTDV